jgi:hypothetical protein
MWHDMKTFLRKSWNEKFHKMNDDVFENEHPPERRDWSIWSVSNNDSLFYDEGKSEQGRSDLESIRKSTRRYLGPAQLILIFSIFGLGALISASVLAFNKWGGNASSQSSTSFTSPGTPPMVDPSGEAALPWQTQNPTGPRFSFDFIPTATPTGAVNPTEPPAVEETVATPLPTRLPTLSPKLNTNVPNTNAPTNVPTDRPTANPTAGPQPTDRPTTKPTAGPQASEPTYIPGNLTTLTSGLLLSEGLDARILAITDQNVPYDLGGWSQERFHGQPDGGATYPDSRPENPGGWIYVSNSEIPLEEGGVGALTFDKDGNVIDYRMLLNNTNMNCGGGRTPWNTWVSCEEVEFTGLIYQVDPTGEREPQVITLGSDGGRWEAFAYDIRDRTTPRFFATEDHSKGTVRRFTPSSPNWDDPWDILHGNGTTDFLMIFPNATNDGGTYQWTNDKIAAKANAKMYYPMTEGIDIYQGQMFVTCKQIHQLFAFDLDDGTYYNHTTKNGLFDGKPDQMQRVIGDSRDLLYFTEEGGVDAGVHARDHLGRFFTVFESPVYPDETTGLSFSPDGRFLYTAYQDSGILYTVWRKDGLPFHAAHLDVKFHHQPS